MDLLDRQFDLDGLLFGRLTDIIVEREGFQPGTASLETADVPHPTTDGVHHGKDFRREGTWAFSFTIDGKDEEDAWRIYNELATVWDAEETRLAAGAVLPLRYCLAGKTRRVYGRPRRFTPANLSMVHSGRIDIEADFTVSYPLFFDDAEQQFGPFIIGVPLELDAGIPVPFIPPFISDAGTTSSSSELIIGGEAKTPLVIEIKAVADQLSGSLVKVDDYFTAAFQEPVVPTNPVTMDARPWVREISTASGGNVAVVPRITRLSKMWLPPGGHELTFTGEDISSTATVTVRWRNAHKSLR